MNYFLHLCLLISFLLIGNVASAAREGESQEGEPEESAQPTADVAVASAAAPRLRRNADDELHHLSFLPPLLRRRALSIPPKAAEAAAASSAAMVAASSSDCSAPLPSPHALSDEEWEKIGEQLRTGMQDDRNSVRHVSPSHPQPQAQSQLSLDELTQKMCAQLETAKREDVPELRSSTERLYTILCHDDHQRFDLANKMVIKLVQVMYELPDHKFKFFPTSASSGIWAFENLVTHHLSAVRSFTRGWSPENLAIYNSWNRLGAILSRRKLDLYTATRSRLAERLRKLFGYEGPLATKGPLFPATPLLQTVEPHPRPAFIVIHPTFDEWIIDHIHHTEDFRYFMSLDAPLKRVVDTHWAKQNFTAAFDIIFHVARKFYWFGDLDRASQTLDYLQYGSLKTSFENSPQELVIWLLRAHIAKLQGNRDACANAVLMATSFYSAVPTSAITIPAVISQYFGIEIPSDNIVQGNLLRETQPKQNLPKGRPLQWTSTKTTAFALQLSVFERMLERESFNVSTLMEVKRDLADLSERWNDVKDTLLLERLENLYRTVSLCEMELFLKEMTERHPVTDVNRIIQHLHELLKREALHPLIMKRIMPHFFHGRLRSFPLVPGVRLAGTLSDFYEAYALEEQKVELARARAAREVAASSAGASVRAEESTAVSLKNEEPVLFYHFQRGINAYVARFMS